VRILWLKSELLHPVDKGGRIRTYQMLRHLKRDHHITYLSLVNPDEPRAAFYSADEYCHVLKTVVWREAPRFSARFYRDLAINLSSPLPFAIEKYRSDEMRREIERETSSGSYDLLVCDFLVPSVNIPKSRTLASVLFQHNVESVIWRRQYETQTGLLRKAFFYDQWRKMLAYEQAACRSFDAVVAVSQVDRDYMREEFRLSEVYDVPTGVDTDYFKPEGSERDPFEVVFTGSMDWMPNEDAIIFFVERILPAVAESVPEVKLTVVGRNPSRRIMALGKDSGRINVTGRVEDIRPYVDRAAAYIVPIRVGGGTRLKIYEAMSMGKAVISTSVGAEGLPLRGGEDLLIADGAEEFATAVVRTLRDEAFARRLGRQARSLVCKRFGWGGAADAFARVCNQVAQNGLRRRAA